MRSTLVQLLKLNKSLVLIYFLFNVQLAFSQTLIEQADIAYSNRNKAGQIDLAVAKYKEALNQDSKNYEIHFKLIEALYFKGYFASKEQEQKEKAIAEMLEHSENTIKLLSKESGSQLLSLKIKQQAHKVKSLQYAAPTYFWNSISWGVWGITFGNIASARKDVATKIRDRAEVLILVDPNYASGAGYRLLGRLHTVAPKIPFFTFWVDRQKGLSLLRKANQISTQDPRNQLFLAEAILEYESSKKEDALELLNLVSKREPIASYYTEQLETINQAKAKLNEQR